MRGLPARGAAVRELGLVLPPSRMALWRRGRPLKRWRYAALYTPELQLCVADARVGPLPRRWWAVAFPDGVLRARTTVGAGGVSIGPRHVRVAAAETRIELELGDADTVETASPVGERGNYIWTAKRAGIAVSGLVRAAGRERRVDGPYGFSDESAGYHPRHTAWRWSAALGRLEDGRRVGWNLVSGIHDAPAASERTLWVDGEPRELGRVRFAQDLSAISFEDGGALDFEEWSAREERVNALLLRSTYRQPFGRFTGELPGGLRLAEAHGVMEDHDAWW